MKKTLLLFMLVYSCSLIAQTSLDAYDLINSAEEKVYSEDYQGAIDDLSKALKLESKNERIYETRASAYSSLKNHQSAINDYTQALSIEPTMVRLYLARSDEYFRAGDNEAALRDLDAAIKLAPTDTELYARRGEFKILIQDPSSSADFEKISVLMKEKIAELTEQVGQGHSDNVGLYKTRANLYKETEQYENAVQDWILLTTLDSGDAAEYHLNIADVLREKLSDNVRALTHYNQVIKMLEKKEPDSETLGQALIGRGTIYLQQGNKLGCQEHKKGVALMPDYWLTPALPQCD